LRLLAAALACAVLLPACNRIGRSSRNAAQPSPSLAQQTDYAELPALGVPMYPGARLARGANGVRAPIPGGNAYLFRIQTRDPAAKVLDFYRGRLRQTELVKGGSPFLVGQTDAGDEVTVVPEERDLGMQSTRGGKIRKLTYTDIMVTVRKMRPVE